MSASSSSDRKGHLRSPQVLAIDNAGGGGSIIVRWIALEPDSAVDESMHEMLDHSEKATADRLRIAADRGAYIATHALLRMILSHITGIPPGDWRFRAGEHGKPEIDRPHISPGLHFSLSHTRGLATCAIGLSRFIGIDAEAWRKPAPIELAERFFSPVEVQLLASRSPAEQAEIFYRLWTLKEAFLKATGDGLTRRLDSFSFKLDPVRLGSAEPDTGEAWYFAEFQPGPAHSLALAVKSARPIFVDARVVSARDYLDGIKDKQRFHK